MNDEEKNNKLKEQYNMVLKADSEVKIQLKELIEKKNKEEIKRSLKDNQMENINKQLASLNKRKTESQEKLSDVKQELVNLQKLKEKIVAESSVKVIVNKYID